MTELAEIKAGVNMLQLWLHMGGDEPQGGKVLCPWHGDSKPSCHLYDDGAKCFACGANGDVFDLAGQVLGLGKREAFEYVAEFAGVRLDGSSQPQRCNPTPRPRPTPKPKPVITTPERASVMASIWRRLEREPLSQQSADWLEGRGIRPNVAYSLGCRDWFRARKQIFDEVTKDTKALEAAGLMRKGRLWTPLKHRIPGLLIPCWLQGDAHPVEWRYRCLEPREDGPKLFAQFQGSRRPLGLRHPQHGRMFRWAHQSKTLIVSEGEPDWLSWYDVMDQAGECLGGVLGLCAISGTQGVRRTPWQPEWIGAIERAERVIVALHNTKRGEEVAKAITKEVIKARGDSCQVLRVRLPEGDDANDLHQRGELLPLLRGLLNHGSGESRRTDNR